MECNISWKSLYDIYHNATAQPGALQAFTTTRQSPSVGDNFFPGKGGGGGDLTKSNMGRLGPKVQPHTHLYTILAEKVPLLYTFY